MSKRIIGVIVGIIFFSCAANTNAQTINILAGNALNGAVNGTLLGAANMAVTNNPDFSPLRVGLGLGTLYGIGVGAYDVSKSGGNPLIVSGSFNDGNNTSIIVLLDTFYGAAAGAIVASSVMLVADEPLVNGLQYGAGIGAWVGFGYGLVDAFMLSERMYGQEEVSALNGGTADGLLAVSFDERKSVGFLSPGVLTTYHSDLTRQFTPTLQVVNVKLNF